MSSKPTQVNEASAAYATTVEVQALPPGYRRTEAGVIPQDWNVSTVGAEFTIQLGKMLDAAKNTGVLKPYIGNRAVRWGQVDLDAIASVPMSPSDLQRFQLQRGDLLVCEGGEIGRAAVWDEPIPECFYQKALHRLRTTRGYDVFLMMSLLQLWSSSGYLSNYVTQTSIAHLPKDKFELVPIPVPPPAEQRIIAEALSDVDGLIGALEKLIAKKRAIKQAAMQQLLTGRTRLQGFNGKWDVARIDEHASIKTGAKNTQDSADDGEYPFFVRSQEVERINTYSYDGEAVLTAGDGVGTGRVFHYINGRFDVHQRVYRIAEFSNRLHGHYFFYQFSTRFYDRIMSMTAKSSVDSVRMEMIAGMQIPVPSPEEQRAMTTVLSDMDAEIAALERRLNKTKQIKQGMMQELLTGRIRLVQLAAKFVPTTPRKAESSRSQGKAPNWQIEQAAVIGVLAKIFGTAKYPLPRKRRVKLTYLLERHVKGKAEGYLKKAAGPYNPATKYRGPEGIALKNGYVREHHNGTYSGFVAGDKVVQAETYFVKWFGADALAWLEQFRFVKTEELELLTTVDMAMEELRAAGGNVDTARVKDVIRGQPEWLAKLDRTVFSDAGIARAIETSRKLFG